MLRPLTILFIGLLLGACGDDISDAKDIVQERLGTRKPEFMNISTFPGGVVCGQYVVMTSDFSTAIDKQPFITVRGTLYQPPNQQQWEFYCGEKPADSLLKRTGIGPYGAGNPELASITEDLTELDTALQSYYRDHSSYPTMRQGIQALVTPPENLATPGSYPRGGYLEKIPLDPWGRPYLYEDDQWGRTKGSFTITTLGADGIAGGDGKNVDISNKHLPYLQHMAALHAQP